MTNDQHAEFEAMVRRIEPKACFERDCFGSYCSGTTRRYLEFFLMMKNSRRKRVNVEAEFYPNDLINEKEGL